RRRTVGSSSQTSSPTSACAIASRMAGVGSVSVSERKSTISCIERLPGRSGHGGAGCGQCLEPPDRPAAPFRIGVFRRHPTIGLLGILRSAFPCVDFAESVQRFGYHQGSRVVLDDVLESGARGGSISLGDVVARDPEFLLCDPSPAYIDLGERIGRV